MSTRCTIGYDTENFHFYEESFDKDKVYLELNDDCFEVIDFFISKEKREIAIGIDVTIWRKIVDSWLNSYWGKNSSLDHKEQEIDTEYINKLVESSLRDKAKKEIKKVEEK
jgi:hypothetical protein